MQQTKIKPLVEGGILSAVAILFALIGAYVPLLGPFANLIWPVPIILLGVRHGYKWSIMASVVSGVLISLLMHPLHAVTVVVGFALTGIVLGYCFRAQYPPFKTLAWGTLASLVSQLAVLAIAAVALGINPINTQVDAMVKSLEEGVQMYRQMGLNEEDTAKMTETMKTIIDYVKIIFPAGLVLSAVVVTYVNYLASTLVLKRLGHYIAPFPPFRSWSLPLYIVYLFVVAVGLMMWGRSQDITLLFNIGMNVQAITSIFLLIQGVALFYFLADKYKLSRLMRGIILVLIFANGLFMQIAILAGAFDIVVDYRRLKGGDNS